MTKFTLSLAGIPMEVAAVYESTKRFCGEYLTSEQPVLSVSVTREDIKAEQALSARYDEQHGDEVRRFPGPYLETLALYRKLAVPLLDFGVLVFHGAAVADGGRCYLFTAPSGTGKTTHVRLWLDRFPGTYVLNGDKPLLRVTDGGVLVCGTPWQGKEDMGLNRILPLAGICILERDDRNHIERVDLSRALGTLIRQTHKPADPRAALKAVALVGQLGTVPLYRLGCNTDPEAAEISHRAMRE